MIPVTVDDLAANGSLARVDPQVCWERSVETLTARKDDIAGLAVASDERIEAYLLYVERRSAATENRVAPLFHRRWWSPSEATALSAPRARHRDLPVPEGPPGRRSRRSCWRRSVSAPPAGISSTQPRRGPPERAAVARHMCGLLVSATCPPRIVCTGSSLSGTRRCPGPMSE